MVNRMLDRGNKTGDLTGAGWTFTNLSPNVTAPGTDGIALTELATGDYVKPTGTNEWYKVATVTDDDNFVLSYDFFQATQTNVVTNYADESVNDGSDASKAFVHMNQYATDEVRSVGDILHCRRGQTHLHEATLLFADEDGTPNSYIYIIADDGTYWAGEGGNAKPIFDFGTSGSRLDWDGGNYWQFNDLGFTNGTGSYGYVRDGGIRNRWINCDFKGGDGGAYGNVFLIVSTMAYFEGCIWEDNGAKCTNHYSGSSAEYQSCAFDNNGLCIDASSGHAYLSDIGFGETTPNIGLNITVTSHGYVIGNNVRLESDAKINVNAEGWDAFIGLMDKDDTKNANKTWKTEGTIERITGTVRSGGSDSSLECVPYANVGDKQPFLMYEIWVYNGGSLTTNTMWMQATDTWAALPTSAQLYIEAYYFNDTDTGRTTTVSTNTISAEDTWTDFNITYNPSGAGPVRLRAYLTKYESGKKIIIDPLVVFT